MAAKKYSLLILISMFSVNLGQSEEPIHCCVESQFTVVERAVTSTLSENGTKLLTWMVTETTANDYDTKELAANIIATDSNGYTLEYKIIEHFDLGFGYIIQDGVCTSFEFEGNMPDNCIPYDRDIEYMGSSRYMGFVPAQSWRMVLWPEDKGQHGIIDVTVAEDGCMPIASAFRGYDDLDDEYKDEYQAVLFYNFTRGIADRDEWFNLPNDCPQYTSNKQRKKIPTTRSKRPFLHVGSHRFRGHGMLHD